MNIDNTKYSFPFRFKVHGWSCIHQEEEEGTLDRM